LAWEGEVGSEDEVFFTLPKTSNAAQFWKLWKLPLKVVTQMLLHYVLCPLLQSNLLKIRLKVWLQVNCIDYQTCILYLDYICCVLGLAWL
jgi:hypothetical protein